MKSSAFNFRRRRSKHSLQAGWGQEDGRVAGAAVVQNHILHPDKLGGGRKMVELRVLL